MQESVIKRDLDDLYNTFWNGVHKPLYYTTMCVRFFLLHDE